MKNKFLSSTLLLILGGFVTRILGFLIKIIYTRMILETGISLHSLVMPTYSLLTTIATLAMPLAISKLVAEEKIRSIKIMASSAFILFIVNSVLLLVMFFSSKFIAYHLLKNEDVYILLLCCTLTLPFISMSSIVKGYFFGKQRMVPFILSNAFEQIVRLILIICFLPFFVKKGILYGVCALILFNIVSEISSIIIFLFFIPKKAVITKKDLKPNKYTIKNVLDVSLPTVSSRFIGNIGFFFEPILLTNILLRIGYSSEFVLMEYGAYNAYTIPLLTMPSFFVGAISSALIPEISKFHEQKKFKMVKRRFYQALGISFVLGLFFSLFIFVFKEKLLWILYHTKSGANYITVLAPLFVLFYLESPLISTLQGLGLAKYTMKITLIGVFLKNIVLVIFSFCHIGIYGLILSEIFNILFVVGANFLKIWQVFKKDSYERLQ